MSGPARVTSGSPVTGGTAGAALPGHSRSVRETIFQRSSRTRGLALGGVLAAALLAGCAGLQDLFKEPDVHLQRVVVQSVGLTGGTLNLIVGVYNPNPFDVQGTKLNLGLDVEQSHVGDVAYDSDFQTQKGDTTVLTLPLTFAWSGVAGAVRTALNAGELPYTINGRLSVATPIGPRDVTFSHQGRAPLSRVGGLIQPSVGH
jgi:LEA14-like dessication related protein